MWPVAFGNWPAGEQTYRGLARTARARAFGNGSYHGEHGGHGASSLLFSVTSVFSVVQLAIEAPLHPVSSISFGDTLGMPLASWRPGGVTKEVNRATRDRVSMP
jgi:hypothetical protein